MTDYVRDPALAAFIDGALKRNPAEHEIVLELIKRMAAAGKPIVKFYDGGERGKFKSDDPFEILDIVFNLDEVYLYTETGAMIFLVFGNDPDELICDYSTSLDDIIDPLMTWMERFA